MSKIQISTTQDVRFVLGKKIARDAPIEVDFDALHDSEKDELRTAGAIAIAIDDVPHIVNDERKLVEKPKDEPAPADDDAAKKATDEAAAAAAKAAAAKAIKKK